MGGPNLLRSPLALTDREGEKIVPVIQNGLRTMTPIPLPLADARAVAAYVRTVMGTIGGQGKPPSAQEPPTILVGNAADGKVYFDSKCASCHSATGDLQGIASRISDARMLQNTWVSGGRGGRRGMGGNANSKPVMVTVTPAGGTAVEGKLVRLDDFFVTLLLDDGSQRTFAREGANPKVEVRDPLEGHRALLPQYTDKNMHDVTAYLVTLK
jgi:cytochrome c oxidase cbb3-type subunit 3